ncbi:MULTISPECIES: Eco57I restriction-modification methylase domain-containing protein [unclassified Endozoicomonas]|uniref:Eco57I restriction-modification methylase domain-containing protein n=1 Tax=unclassified Endozoicomonas TaxID=2644528 RepID=UPI003BB6B176
MSDFNQHAEWLSLLDISGPFLAVPVLKKAFPQDLDKLEPAKKKKLNQAYEEWLEAQENDDVDLAKIHQEWINLVLGDILEWFDEDENSLVAGDNLPTELRHILPEYGITLRPDFGLVDDQTNQCMLLVQTYAPGYDLQAPSKGDGWTASATERMVQLCRATGVRLALVTNGEQWMLIDAPVGAVTTFASWYGRIWQQEPVTLRAFISLLGIRRFFVDDSEKLPALLDESLKHQDEVTDALGEQVRRAVEVLVQSLDRADQDRNRELLRDVQPAELYEAGLTVMMRLVFLLCAEERELLLLGDERFEAHYAVSTLRMQLREVSDEVLERRLDGWSRLLAIFRAVYGGVEHEGMRMPALGGSLFDPDRFPFLEGRAKGSYWKTDPAKPLPIDNRTVLLLLDSIQLFQGRSLSYRALDVEQIGYVYEGLLERTVKKATDVTLELDATRSAKKPWITLGELESARLDGQKRFETLLQERTGSSASRVRNDLAKTVDETSSDKLLTACNGDEQLRDRLLTVFHLLQTDRWGYPLVYPKGAYMVAMGADRRETGSHYTPKSLTEAIVKETLEPVAYIGPAEGKERQDWVLKPAAELLDLKICDLAMGSGAFLVQVCRWLSERLVEAWDLAEKSGRAISSEGEVLDTLGKKEPLSAQAEERLLTARRLIAERCLYGVDMNPLAVELAKLSIWLITLAKGRPFGFLDHNLRHGDSLLGIQNLDQLLHLNMDTANGQRQLFAQKIEQAVHEAIELRKTLRLRPIRDIKDVEVMAHLDAQAKEKLRLPELVADALIGETLKHGGKTPDTTILSIYAGEVLNGDKQQLKQLEKMAERGLATDLPSGKPQRKPFHWHLEFPEVFVGRHGFDAIIGNPPFVGGQKISGSMGSNYRNFIVNAIAHGVTGSADMSAYFFLKSYASLNTKGCLGLIAVNTIAEGDTRQVGLDMLVQDGASIYSAHPNQPWPGKAAVITSRVHISKRNWLGARSLLGAICQHISSYLTAESDWSPAQLNSNKELSYIGSYVLGLGFTMDEVTAREQISKNMDNERIIFPYLTGKDLNEHVNQEAGRWIINFWDWPIEKAKGYSWAYDRLVAHVKEERQAKKDKTARDKWWLFLRPRGELYHKIGRGDSFIKHPKGWFPSPRNENVICNARVGKYFSPSLVPNLYVFNEKIVVFSFSEYGWLGFLNSTLINEWIWKHSSRLKMDLNFSPSDAFETLPLPDRDQIVSSLNVLGERLHQQRQASMELRGIGLTKFNNLVHSGNCNDQDISDFRRTLVCIDQKVLDLYGWTDIDLKHGFHERHYLPAGDNIRFAICEWSRTSILARMAQLNKEMYEQGSLANTVPAKGKKISAKKTVKPKVAKKSEEAAPQMGLFQPDPEPPKKAAGNQWGSTAIHQICAWLENNEGKAYSRDVILNSCGADPKEWDSAIKELLADGDVEQLGSGDKLRYRAKL